MKKLLGLLAICSLVACNDSSDSVAAPQWGNNGNTAQQGGENQGQDTRTPEQIADSIAKHVADSVAALYGQQNFSSAMGGYSSALLMSSSSALTLVSSSSMVVVSSSSLALSSMTNPVRSSSSRVTPKSSAAVDPIEEDDGLFKLGLWDGTAGDGQVPTGNKSGGYWYYYTDKGDKGKSTFTWSEDVDGTNGFADLIANCGGVCGDFDLVVGTNPYKPYVGIGFNYSKSDNLSADATSSKGICVTYKSTIAINLEMGLGSMDAKIGYANPFVVLPKSTAATTEDFRWSDFEQPEWAETAVTKPETKLVSLKFKFAGTEDGEDGGSGSFNIMKVGPYGGCN